MNDKNCKKNVCLIFGGRSTEYKVSLRSVENVILNIDREKYNVSTVGITADGKWYLYRGGSDDIVADRWQDGDIYPVHIDPSCGAGGIYYTDSDGAHKLDVDVVFPVVHGKYCEDGTMQGLLSMCGIPYVGPGCAASAICMDKTLTKLILSDYEIPQANAVSVTARELESSPDEVAERIENIIPQYPVFVKPSSSGSSVGASKAADRASMLEAMRDAARYDRKILVEEYIVGREVEIAALEGEDGGVIMSCCGEIDPGDGFYDYETKYENDKASYFIPARIKPETEMRIKETASLIFGVLGCQGLSRIDFFVRDFKGTEQIVFNEINTLPGFTSISMYPQLMQQIGISYKELITRLIELAHV